MVWVGWMGAAGCAPRVHGSSRLVGGMRCTSGGADEGAMSGRGTGSGVVSARRSHAPNMRSLPRFEGAEPSRIAPPV